MIFLWLYFIGVAVSIIPIYRVVYVYATGEFHTPADEGENRLMAAVMAVMGCWFWPLVLVGLVVIHFGTPAKAEKK